MSPSVLLTALLAATAFAFVLALALAFRAFRRTRARACPRCGDPLRLLSEVDEDLYLSDRAQHEELLGGVDYDVWLCECGYAGSVRHQAALSDLSDCVQCGAHAVRSEETTVYAPRNLTAGLARVDTECLHCGATDMYTKNLTLGAFIPRPGGEGSVFGDGDWDEPEYFSIGGPGY